MVVFDFDATPKKRKAGPPVGKLKSTKYEWKKWSSITKLTDYVVLDLETTGLSPSNDRIIEIGIVKISGGVPTDEYSSLINPEIPLPSRIKKITGLSDEDLIGAPSFSEIADEVMAFLGKELIIGHNVTFDLSFLEEFFSRSGIDAAFTYLDTLTLARRAYPNLSSHKLPDLNAKFSLYDGPSHRAIDDALCTQALFCHICKLYQNSSYVDAVFACCTPIEGYKFTPKEKPLSGKSFMLVGTFTFPYAAARKLITSAGGTLKAALDDSVDYLLYGYPDEINDPENIYDSLRSKAISMRDSDGKIQLINEVGLLKMCGITFY